MGSAVAAEPEEPGLNELVILDPGIDETGLPAVLINHDNEVEIPPVVHVHRYYYSGNKEYQGPTITGGPTTVVANHPRTSERLYIDVMLPPGTPKIAYNKHSITYVYLDKRVVIQFSRLFPRKVTIKHLSGRGFRRSFREKSKGFSQKLHEARQKSKLAQTIHDVLSERKNIAKGAVGVVETAANTVLEKANQAFNLAPGVQLLKSIGQRAEESQAFEQIRQAGLEQTKNATKFIPTIR